MIERERDRPHPTLPVNGEGEKWKQMHAPFCRMRHCRPLPYIEGVYPLLAGGNRGARKVLSFMKRLSPDSITLIFCVIWFIWLICGSDNGAWLSQIASAKLRQRLQLEPELA